MDKLSKAKEAALDVRKKMCDGIDHVQTAMSSITSEQDKKIKESREDYFKKLKENDEVAIEAKMNEYAMEVYQTYLSYICKKYSPIRNEAKNVDNRIRFFDITKWVIDKKEKNIDKLINVYQVLSQQECNIALIYTRNQQECHVTIAVSNTGKSDSPDLADQYIERIKKSIKGNFPGVQLSEKGVGSPISFREKIDDEYFYYSVAAISNLASDKSEDFVSQNMEKLLDGIVPTCNEENYALVLLASPFKNIENTKAELTDIYSKLSSAAQRQTNRNVSEGKMLGAGSNIAANAAVNLGFQVGINIAKAVNSMEQVGSSTGTTFTYTNYAVKHLLDTIEKQIAHLEESEALGMWNFAAYAISADANIAEDVAHMYLSLTQGSESYMSKAAINLWEGGFAKNEDAIATILKDISELRHPQFAVCLEDENDFSFPSPVDLTTHLSGKDLARALNFPQKSVAGLPVVESVSFGREIYRNNNLGKINNSIKIGNVYHMHSIEEKTIDLDVDSLCSHTLITGSTGKGKSNIIYKLIELISENKRNEEFSFMVVEPAKGEYKDAFWKHPSIKVRVLGTNPKEAEILKINPFEFPERIHILEHIDRLVEIFNACWPMYAAMPAILKNAIIKAYEACGWDLVNSESKTQEYPSFNDVLEEIKKILNSSAFSEDNKGDYTGALCTRVESLTTGLNGLIFTDNSPCTSEKLFQQNVVIDLSRVGAPDTISLIMSLLVMKLQEFRMSEGIGANLPLRHLTILEEAHNILKRTSTDQSTDSSNVRGKAVEVISNAIAEMRTYGEGFIIADQAPGLLDASVIRNTNTKIVLCLPGEEDRQIVGKSIGLSDSQISEVAKLERGVAAVYQNDWQEAVLCKFGQFHKDYSNEERLNGYPKDKERYLFDKSKKIKTVFQAKIELLKYLLSKVVKIQEPYSVEMKEELLNAVSICGFKIEARRNFIRIINSDVPDTIEGVIPFITYLYDPNALLDNRTAISIEDWNIQILQKLDPSLLNLEHWYRNGLIQCLLYEQSRMNEEFRPYAQKWVEYMSEKDVK